MPTEGDRSKNVKGEAVVYKDGTWVLDKDTSSINAPTKEPSKEAQAEGKAVLGGTKKSTFSEPAPAPPAADAGLTEQAKYTKAKREWERRRAAAELTAGKQAEAVK